MQGSRVDPCAVPGARICPGPPQAMPRKSANRGGSFRVYCATDHLPAIACLQTHRASLHLPSLVGPWIFVMQQPSLYIDRRATAGIHETSNVPAAYHAVTGNENRKAVRSASRADRTGRRPNEIGDLQIR